MGTALSYFLDDKVKGNLCDKEEHLRQKRKEERACCMAFWDKCVPGGELVQGL